MSAKYQQSTEVPTEVLVKRLDELSNAVVARMQGNNASFQSEFTCRIPAELDRDADLVLNGAAMRLIELDKRIKELEQAIMSNCYDDSSTSGKRLMALVTKGGE